MTSGEKLVLYHVLEKAGYIVCEETEDIDPKIITLKLWHKGRDMVEVLEYAMEASGGVHG